MAAHNIANITNSTPGLNGEFFVCVYDPANDLSTIKASTWTGNTPPFNMVNLGYVRQDAPFTRSAPSTTDNRDNITFWGGDTFTVGSINTDSVEATVTLAETLNTNLNKFVFGETSVVDSATDTLYKDEGINTEFYTIVVNGHTVGDKRALTILPKVQCVRSGDIVEVDNEIRQYEVTLNLQKEPVYNAYAVWDVAKTSAATQKAPITTTTSSSGSSSK